MFVCGRGLVVLRAISSWWGGPHDRTAEVLGSLCQAIQVHVTRKEGVLLGRRGEGGGAGGTGAGVRGQETPMTRGWGCRCGGQGSEGAGARGFMGIWILAVILAWTLACDGPWQ